MEAWGTATPLERWVSGRYQDRSAEENMVMPALLWVAFWSSMLATAACFGEVPRPIPVKAPKRRELSSGD
jgi:hypothetical protein